MRESPNHSKKVMDFMMHPIRKQRGSHDTGTQRMRRKGGYWRFGVCIVRDKDPQ